MYLQISYRINQLYKDLGGSIEEETAVSDSSSTATAADSKSKISLPEFMSVMEKVKELICVGTDEFLGQLRGHYGDSLEAAADFAQGMMAISEQ